MEILTTRNAVDQLNLIIRILRQHDYPELIKQLDEIRQFLGRDL